MKVGKDSPGKLIILVEEWLKLDREVATLEARRRQVSHDLTQMWNIMNKIN